MLTCRKTFIVLVFFISFKANSQKVYTAFPKTNYHFILPDSSFKVNYDSTGFFSEKYSSKISVEPFETGDGENDYHSLVKLLMLEISRQGTTILLDKELDSNHRVLKIKVDFEITDSRPYEKGVSNILWIYITNDNGMPQMLNVEYGLKHDLILSDLMLASVQTFSPQKND